MRLQNESDHHASALIETTRSVLENAAFAMVDDPEMIGGMPPLCENRNILAARVRFHGAFSGTMALSMTSHLACELAAGMLGLDADAPEALLRQGDTVGELLNMVCGNLLPAIAGPSPEFAISTPELIAPCVCRNLVDAHPERLKSSAVLIAEEEPVHVALLLDPPGFTAN